MKIFISWSGKASRNVADLLRKTLPCMIQQLEPFMSDHDLSSGGRWAEQLSAKLDQCNFGIICLTPENLREPWILFEAGALTKHVEGRACCLLFQDLGLADVSGPLSQFQNRLFSRNEFRQMLFDLNKLVEKRLDDESLQRVFDKWWPGLDEQVQAALDDPDLASPVSSKRDVPDMLEEILVRLRSLQSETKGKSTRSLALSDVLKDFRRRYDLDVGDLNYVERSPGNPIVYLSSKADQLLSTSDIERIHQITPFLQHTLF